MSDTPRTDSESWRDNEEFDEVVSADFARQLERELNSVLQSLERVQHERDIWRARALDEVEP